MHEMLGADGADVTTAPSGEIDRFDFNQSVAAVIGWVRMLRVVRSSIVLITKAMQRRFVIPDWYSFCVQITSVYQKCYPMRDGQVGIKYLMQR
jgi:hypothetical protein